jgi:Zn finger protein HypA/HybF involved in hydrogenase expression
MTEKIPLFMCQECGKKFYTTAAAWEASFGDKGCPKCGGSDIDVYTKEDFWLTKKGEKGL